jgi:hypothetical protein
LLIILLNTGRKSMKTHYIGQIRIVVSGKLIFLGVLIGVLLGACAVPQKKVDVVNIGKSEAYAITYPTELRGAYFMKRGDLVRYCAEPAPDVASETLQKIAAEISATLAAGKEIKGKVDTELGSKVIQLAGRTELILLAREMLYRACELTLNYPDTGSFQQALTMYMRVADLVQDFGRADRALAEAELLKVSFGKDENSKCIQNWLDEKASNVEMLLKWLNENAGGISIAMFLYGKDYSEKRGEFVKTKNIKCD